MTTPKAYWNTIEFDYLKIYSVLRGESFKTLKVQLNQSIQQLQKDLETAQYMQQSKIKAKIEHLENIVDFRSDVINKHGVLLGTSAIIIHKVKSDGFVEQLGNILNTTMKAQYTSACVPIFRDAIVFYSNDNKIKGVLRICFECFQVSNKNDELLQTDMDTFAKLATLLGINEF